MNLVIAPQGSVLRPVSGKMIHRQFPLLSAIWISFQNSLSHRNKPDLVCSLLPREPISYCWTQYKKRHHSERDESISRTEFKAFIRKNLGESRLFVDGIWMKFKRDFQCQLEEVWDWTLYLNNIQSFLLEFRCWRDSRRVRLHQIRVRKPQALHEGSNGTTRARIRQLRNTGWTSGRSRRQNRLSACFLHPRNGSPMLGRKPPCQHHFVQGRNQKDLNEWPQGPQDRKAKAKGVPRFKQLWKLLRQL